MLSPGASAMTASLILRSRSCSPSSTLSVVESSDMPWLPTSSIRMRRTSVLHFDGADGDAVTFRHAVHVHQIEHGLGDRLDGGVVVVEADVVQPAVQFGQADKCLGSHGGSPHVVVIVI